MKTKLYKFASLLLAFAMIFALVSCGITDGGKNNGGNGEMTLVVMGDTAKEYRVDLGELKITKGLVSVLDYLKETEGLTYEMSGTFINDVNGIVKNGPSGAYACIYTSVSADFDVTQYVSTAEYNGKTLTSSGVGALEMHIERGALIMIKLEVWKG